MSRVWFSQPLETAAVFWRVLRTDGITLGFTTHDRDLWLEGVLHRAAPGMVPSAIRRTAGFDADSAEVEGALSHDSISAADLAAGRFDNARVFIGLIDWESGDNHTLFRGSIGTVSRRDDGFSAQLQSRKAELSVDHIPRTSPACRATFCGPGCGLSPTHFIHEGVLLEANLGANTISVTNTATGPDLIGGTVSWLDGPHAGTTMGIVAVDGSALLVDGPLLSGLEAGMRLELREGCDRTLATCSSRFANAVNFQGEPFLPGNDLMTRYPTLPE